MSDQSEMWAMLNAEETEAFELASEPICTWINGLRYRRETGEQCSDKTKACVLASEPIYT